jgi:hypothetical protein
MKRSLIPAAVAAALPALLLSGCYVVPIGSDQLDRLTRVLEQGQTPAAAPTATPNAAVTAGAKAIPPAASGASAPVVPMTLQARLYPTNDIATEVGMVSGTVTNMMNGKGRVQLAYRGEILTGEATRVEGDSRKGMANAWGPNGGFMSCEYQMSAPVRGAGTCIFSDGARYQVHVGN